MVTTSVGCEMPFSSRVRVSLSGNFRRAPSSVVRLTRISEPGGHIFWDGKSNYFVLQLPDVPSEDTTLRLTLTYADGRTDRITMNFNAPTE